MQSLASTGLSRRTLAKGTAWAAPAVLATTVIPAYAASQDLCGTSLNRDTQIKIYGRPAGGVGTFQMWFDFGDITVTIPKGRTVTSATVGFTVSKHSGTNDGSIVGLPSPSNRNTKYYPANGSSRGSLTNIASGANGTFWNFTDNVAVNSSAAVGPGYPFKYVGESSQTWLDGTSSTGWSIETTWKTGDTRQAVVDSSSDPSCTTVTFNNLGGIQWVAQNVYIPVDKKIPLWRYWTVTLDDGTVLSGRDGVENWQGDPDWVARNS